MEGIKNKELIDYIEQNNVSCARIDGVFLIGIKDVDIIIDRVKNSVVLADVSQQSELLNNFSSWLNQEYKLNIPPDEDDVNRYLKNYK